MADPVKGWPADRSRKPAGCGSGRAVSLALVFCPGPPLAAHEIEFASRELLMEVAAQPLADRHRLKSMKQCVSFEGEDVVAHETAFARLKRDHFSDRLRPIEPAVLLGLRLERRHRH
jgi:hypothetical protein